jgi:hypothetical protein
MKIQLLRASKIVKEIEFAATMPPLDIQRLSVDLMFENKMKRICGRAMRIRAVPATKFKSLQTMEVC